MKSKTSSKCPECKGSGEYRNGRGGPMMKCMECDGTGKAQHFQMMFWRYSQFPFVLASRGFMNDNGTCYCPSYNARFQPVKVLPMEDGEKVKAELETLTMEYNKLLTIIDRAYRIRVKQIAPWAIKK